MALLQFFNFLFWHSCIFCCLSIVVPENNELCFRHYSRVDVRSFFCVYFCCTVTAVQAEVCTLCTSIAIQFLQETIVPRQKEFYSLVFCSWCSEDLRSAAWMDAEFIWEWQLTTETRQVFSFEFAFWMLAAWSISCHPPFWATFYSLVWSCCARSVCFLSHIGWEIVWPHMWDLWLCLKMSLSNVALSKTITICPLNRNLSKQYLLSLFWFFHLTFRLDS